RHQTLLEASPQDPFRPSGRCKEPDRYPSGPAWEKPADPFSMILPIPHAWADPTLYQYTYFCIESQKTRKAIAQQQGPTQTFDGSAAVVTSARGAPGSSREGITTGRVLTARRGNQGSDFTSRLSCF